MDSLNVLGDRIFSHASLSIEHKLTFAFSNNCKQCNNLSEICFNCEIPDDLKSSLISIQCFFDMIKHNDLKDGMGHGRVAIKEWNKYSRDIVVYPSKLNHIPYNATHILWIKNPNYK